MYQPSSQTSFEDLNMSTRIKTTAGAIITTAMLGTLLPVTNSARAEESEFCDPVEVASPAKKPRKVMKAKAPRKASAHKTSARKVIAAKPGVKKVAKLVKAKPKKPMSLADRLRSKARRMMLAALGPKKAKMCRPRTLDQLGLLDKLVPASGELPSGGGTPFKFTPDTSIGSLANVFSDTGRIFDPGRIGAYTIPGGGGGGGGGFAQPAALPASASVAAPVDPASTAGPSTNAAPAVRSEPATTTITTAPVTPTTDAPSTTTNNQTSPGANITPITNTNPITPIQPGTPTCTAGAGSGAPSGGTNSSGGGATTCTDITPGGGTTTSGGGTVPIGGSTSGGPSTSGGGTTTSGGGTVPIGGSTSGGDTQPIGGTTSSGGGAGCGASLGGGGIPGGVINPLPGGCGTTNPGGGTTSGGAQVPEPGALSLLGLGLLAACWQRRRRA
jgi:hypothetical protein